MKYLRKILLRLATSLSLLACLAAACFWHRSRHIAEQLYTSHWQTQSTTADESAWFLMSDFGRLGIAQRYQRVTIDPAAIPWFQSLTAHPVYSRKHLPPGELLGGTRNVGPFPTLGFTYSDDPLTLNSSTGGFRQVTVPFWSVCLLTMLLPAWRLHRYLRPLKILPHHCPTCGYDLRATPHRCPECGKDDSYRLE